MSDVPTITRHRDDSWSVTFPDPPQRIYPVAHEVIARFVETHNELTRLAELLAAALLTRGVTADQCDALDQWLRRSA